MAVDALHSERFVPQRFPSAVIRLPMTLHASEFRVRIIQGEA
ncbi:MAG: hypothetical protein P1V35_08285 [Planctomycetota bacterium]|nr:hypothetical protein [Planctomycetota bacterium]